MPRTGEKAGLIRGFVVEAFNQQSYTVSHTEGCAQANVSETTPALLCPPSCYSGKLSLSPKSKPNAPVNSLEKHDSCLDPTFLPVLDPLLSSRHGLCSQECLAVFTLHGGAQHVSKQVGSNSATLSPLQPHSEGVSLGDRTLAPPPGWQEAVLFGSPISGLLPSRAA